MLHARESIINYFFLVEIDEMEQEAPLPSSNPIGVRTI